MARCAGLADGAHRVGEGVPVGRGGMAKRELGLAGGPERPVLQVVVAEGDARNFRD